MPSAPLSCPLCLSFQGCCWFPVVISSIERSWCRIIFTECHRRCSCFFSLPSPPTFLPLDLASHSQSWPWGHCIARQDLEPLTRFTGVSHCTQFKHFGDEMSSLQCQRNTPDSPAPQTDLEISVTGNAVLSKKHYCARQLGLKCLLCLVGNTPSLGFFGFCFLLILFIQILTFDTSVSCPKHLNI